MMLSKHFTSSLNLLRFCWPLAELSLRVLMRFIRRKSDGKREGHFTFRGISWMTLPTIEISLIAFGFFSNQRNKDNTSFIWNSRIQEQLRRIKRNQEKEKLQPVKKKKEKPPNNVSTLIHLYCCKVWGTIVEQPRWAEGPRFLNPKIFSFNLSPLYLLLHFLITKKLRAYIPACWSQWCFLTLEVNAALIMFPWKPDTSDLPLLEVRNLLPPSVYLVSVLFGFCLTAPFRALPPITSSTAAYGKSYRNTWHLYSIWDSFQ